MIKHFGEREGPGAQQPGFLGLLGLFGEVSIEVIGPADGRFPRRKPRVNAIRGLPEDWREQFFTAMETDLHLARLATIVIAATGCRPAEVSGAEVHILQDTLRLVVSNSKKQAGRRGAEDFPREMTFACSVGPLAELAKLGGPGTVIRPFRGVNPKAVQDLIRRTSRRAFPKRLQDVTASCFRNQLSADMKAAGFCPADIASALGHCTTRTQNYYGRAALGRGGGWLPILVSRAADIRVAPRPHFLGGNGSASDIERG